MLGLIGFLDGEIEETPRPHGAMEVGEHGRPLFARRVFYRVDTHHRVELALECELLQADLLEPNVGVLPVRCGEHARGLVDADDTPPGRHDCGEVRAHAAPCVENRTAEGHAGD
jgi:hypothetical protein